MKKLEIIETPMFTEDIDKILGQGEYRDLQLKLIETPAKGNLITGTVAQEK